MTTCPKCGGRIQATVPVYLDAVELSSGRVIDFELAMRPEGPLAWDVARLYCEHGHPIKWRGVGDELRRLVLTPWPASGPALADQDEDDVTLRDLLDKWRADAWLALRDLIDRPEARP